jgi:hypothetical protein
VTDTGENYTMRSFIICTLRQVKFRITNSTRMKWEGHVARMGEKRNACRILVGEPEGKRPLGRPRRKWVDNIKIDLREIRWGGVDWIDLAAQLAASQEKLSSMKLGSYASFFSCFSSLLPTYISSSYPIFFNSFSCSSQTLVPSFPPSPFLVFLCSFSISYSASPSPSLFFSPHSLLLLLFLPS